MSNPPNWPSELQPVFDKFVTCEYASLTKSGAPVTVPVIPYVNAELGTLSVSTGLTYPTKAERARRNPKVALLYSDPTGSGLDRPATALVIGLAAIRDRDVQANLDRYVRESMRKVPGATKGYPKFLLRRNAWYFARIWIEVMPLGIVWWPGGDLRAQPLTWHAPGGTTAPASDPVPQGAPPGAWKAAPTQWESVASSAVARFGMPVITTVDATGFPVPVRATSCAYREGAYWLELPRGVEAKSGPACATFHSHPGRFTGQENIEFVGKIAIEAEQAVFTVEREIADFSAGGANRWKTMRAFTAAQKHLEARLAIECERRGAAVPRVNL